MSSSTTVGVWSLAVNLSGSRFQDSSAVAEVVIEVLFFVAVTVAVYFLPREADSLQPAFDHIRWGGKVLVLWYLTKTVDLFLHEAQLHAAYGYILFYFFIECFKFSADVRILLGTHRVLTCRLYGQLGIPILWVLTGEFLSILLVLSQLYYLGSYLGNEVLWLNVADQSIISDLASRKDAFATAFFVLQYFFALLTFAGSLISAWYWRKESQVMPVPKLTSQKEVYLAVAATASLWIRSFSELIIVVQYEQHNPTVSTSTSTSRGFVYGLCTVAFLVLIAPVGRNTSIAAPQDPIQQAVEHDCQEFVTRTVGDKVSVGQRAPALPLLFQRMRNSPGPLLDAQTIQLLHAADRVNEQETLVLDYIGRLEALYRNWEPQ